MQMQQVESLLFRRPEFLLHFKKLKSSPNAHVGCYFDTSTLPNIVQLSIINKNTRTHLLSPTQAEKKIKKVFTFLFFFFFLPIFRGPWNCLLISSIRIWLHEFLVIWGAVPELSLGTGSEWPCSTCRFHTALPMASAQFATRTKLNYICLFVDQLRTSTDVFVQENIHTTCKPKPTDFRHEN